MSSSATHYYEYEGFWTDSAFGKLDRERIEHTVQLIPATATSVLDAGCGNGLFCNSLAMQRPELRVVGVDRSAAALAKVRTEKYSSSIAQLPFEAASFDCVCALQVLEHLPIDDYAAALDELTRVARHHIVISVPYRERRERNVTQCPECLTVFNVDLHLRSYTRETVSELLDSRGFRCERTETLGVVEQFLGHELYRRVAFPGQHLSWRSPICPLCGYTRDEQPRTSSSPPQRAPSVVSQLIAKAKDLPKAWWPKERYPYWIVAIYRKI